MTAATAALHDDVLVPALWSRPGPDRLLKGVKTALSEMGLAQNVRQRKDAFCRDILLICSVSYDAYELGDIVDRRLSDCNVYVFSNAFTLTDELRAKIKAHVWLPGKLDATENCGRSACLQQPKILRFTPLTMCNGK